MRREHIQQALEAAHSISKHHEFVIAGSLSVLGLLDQPPEFMSMSIDIDFYPLRDPNRASEIAQELGEGSPFHNRHGFYLDPISPALPTLPDGWQERLVEHKLGQVTALFLDVNDTAVSKYTRGAENDYRWLEEGYKANLLSINKIYGHMQFNTSFFDPQEKIASLSRLRMHQLAIAPSGKLDLDLLGFLHQNHLEDGIKDLDLNEGSYNGRILWTSDFFAVQSLANGATAVHLINECADKPEVGTQVTLTYQNGVITNVPAALSSSTEFGL